MNSSSDDQPYIPPTKPYELSHLAADLVLLGRYLLKPNGRLVFFLPTVTDEYEEVDIHTMLCEGMEVIANSLQDFGSWGRRVCYMHRIFLLFTQPSLSSSLLSGRQHRRNTPRPHLIPLLLKSMKTATFRLIKISERNISRDSSQKQTNTVMMFPCPTLDAAAFL